LEFDIDTLLEFDIDTFTMRVPLNVFPKVIALTSARSA
jgi:hypothetical protein